MTKPINPHRYSGWPGAYCLDCGSPDPVEEALAHGCDWVVCRHCKTSYPTGDQKCTPEREALPRTCDIDDPDCFDWFWPHEVDYGDCGQHGSEECPADD